MANSVAHGSVRASTTQRKPATILGKQLAFSLACGVLLPSAGHAQTLDPVVVTATRNPQQASRLVSDVSVVESERLQTPSARSFADLLRQEPGVQIGSNGGPGATSSLFIRGANSGQSLLMIEGFRIGSATLGSPTPEGINPLLFSRVELLRGPASSLYGADAIGGAVNLMVQAPSGSAAQAGQAFVQAALGTNQTRSLSGGVQVGGANFGASLRLAEERSDGFNVSAPGKSFFNPDRDGFERRSAAFSGHVDAAAGHRIGLVAYSDDLNNQFDEGAILADARTRLRTQLVGLTSTHQLSPSLVARLRFGRSTDDSTAVSNFPGRFQTDQTQWSGQLDWQASSAWLVSGLVERLEQKVQSTNWGPGVPQGRDTTSARLGAVMNQGSHTAQLGIRLDDSSQYGDRTTGNLGYGYRIAPAWRLGGQLSTGFKAPSFNDLYFPFFGRPEIRPETSRNAEAGLYYSLSDSANSRTEAKLVIYRNRLRDLIVFNPVCPNPDPSFVFGCADNVNTATLTGASLGVSRRSGSLRWFMNLDWLDAHNDTLDRTLPRRAARTLSAGVSQSFGAVRLGSSLQSASSRFDNPSNSVRLGGFTIVNVDADVSISKHWTVFARINNVADKRYQTAEGFFMQGFHATLGVRATLQ
jgi:vitamin B12 transporter